MINLIAVVIWIATIHAPGPQSTPVPTPIPTVAAPGTAPRITGMGGMTLGLNGHVECWNCALMEAKIRLTNYDPMLGPINCWDYQDDYCWSKTASGVHWKALWGFSAACPMEWPYGTWVAIPGVGAFICMDRGGLIKCDAQGVCAVDILGPSGEWWNGQEFEVQLWVPLNPERGTKYDGKEHNDN